MLRVVLDRQLDERADAPLKVFDYDLTEGDCTLKIYADEYRLTLRAGDVEATIACPVEAAAADGVAEYSADLLVEGKKLNWLLFNHALVFAYSFASLPHKTLLIHSSVVVKDGGAVMCLGESGTGKSTHARLWLENIASTEHLNDDGPVVRVMDDGGVEVFGSPWSGKGAVFRQAHYPVKGFLRLSQAPHNRITRLKGMAAFGALLPSSLPTLQQEERTLDLLCGALSDMVCGAAAYHLECLPNSEAAQLSYETIFAAAGYR